MGIFKKKNDDSTTQPPPVPAVPPAANPATLADPSLAVYANASLGRARALMNGARMDNTSAHNVPAPELAKPSLLGAA